MTWSGPVVRRQAVGSEGIDPSLLRRALLVESEPEVRQLLRTHLELAGFQLEETADGRVALDRLRSIPYDVVILDAMVPNVDAITLCRAARSGGPNVDAGVAERAGHGIGARARTQQRRR